MNRKKSLFTFFEQRIKKVLILTLAIGSFAFVGSANAALLKLTLKASPDISVNSIEANYNGTDTFTATGAAHFYDSNFITGGIFNLTASIDVNGILSGGSFTVNGDVGGSGNQTLLMGALTNVGFDSTSTQLEFEYAATGGTLASVFSGAGGIIMNGVGISAALFNNGDFSDTGGLADVGKIPEPLSVLLFGAGLLALGVRQRRSKTI